jgi:hypothetical protein
MVGFYPLGKDQDIRRTAEFFPGSTQAKIAFSKYELLTEDISTLRQDSTYGNTSEVRVGSEKGCASDTNRFRERKRNFFFQGTLNVHAEYEEFLWWIYIAR